MRFHQFSEHLLTLDIDTPIEKLENPQECKCLISYDQQFVRAFLYNYSTNL